MREYLSLGSLGHLVLMRAKFYLILVGTVAAGAWLADDIRDALKGAKWEWEPLITFVGLLVALLGPMAAKTLAKTADPNDVALYKKLVALIPPADIGAFYRQHDFLLSFLPRYADAVHRFRSDWDNPDYEFLDAKLEQARRRLYVEGAAMAEALAKYTAPNRNGHISVIPTGLMGDPIPDEIRREAHILNQTARQFSHVFDEFVRLARAD